MTQFAQIIMIATSVMIGAPSQRAHIVKDAQDAIATAHAEWKAAYPNSDIADEQAWQKEFTAELVNGVWVIKQKVEPSNDRVGGAIIYLSPQDGHILHAEIKD